MSDYDPHDDGRKSYEVAIAALRAQLLKERAAAAGQAEGK